MNKLRVGILGATGMVGQRFITMLQNHPWFEVSCLAASPQSAGKSYEAAVEGKWLLDSPIPEAIKNLLVRSVEEDFSSIIKEVDFVLSALNMDKEKIKEIENKYAEAGIPVVSNNSAHRSTADVPMVIPEINPAHLEMIDIQRKNRGWNKGFIVVKPNCSIQSYVPILNALMKFEPTNVAVTTLQAISGAGKTFATWPEMVDNVIPFIEGEEEKSEQEPLKIWGEIFNNEFKIAELPKISATCIRVPTANGHMASVLVKFKTKPTFEEIINSVTNFNNPIAEYNLPSAPKQFIKYFTEPNRPQTKLDRDYENGMGITMGRLKEYNNDSFDWKFVALSHNTIRGAAGGAILVAELLKAKNYL